MHHRRILLVDVGNTNTHFAVADVERIFTKRPRKLPTAALEKLAVAVNRRCDRLVACCVVPQKLPALRRVARLLTGHEPLLLTQKLNLGIGIRYPHPAQIGGDRLANAIGAAYLYGVFARKPFRGPVIVVDFGSAVTFDIVSGRGEFLGGVIGPGLTAMTDYLYEKTALLPRITIREPRRAIGKSTVEAMRVGAVIGYRGLVREILHRIQSALGAKKLRVVATGGYGSLIAAKLPEIERIDSLLTLQGLRIVYIRNREDHN